ncbi:MAG: mannose-1-phosphate guanylyltransferase [Bradymonadaceae bacterium]
MIAVILAGGAGTRFWPSSRRHRPKQLLELAGDRPLIRQTADRLRDAPAVDDLLVVCGDHLVDALSEALPGVRRDQFVVEPAPRDTAPAFALACAHVSERLGDEPVGLFPADHYIDQLDRFHDCLARAESAADAGSIATMGIEPTRPETGYGYIRYTPDAGTDGVHPVEAFVEKPDRQTALSYLESGSYLWNSGMFFMRPSVLYREMGRQMAESREALDDIRDELAADRDAAIGAPFERMEATSLDYGVMEGAEDVVVVPATFTWSDVGHWAAVDSVTETDSDGNAIRGDVLAKDTEDSVVVADGTDRFVAAVDLDGMVVVDTPDALLVIPKEKAQRVKEVVRDLEDAGRDDLL